MPIAWTDLKPSLRPERFTVKSTPAHLVRRRADPWRHYSHSQQRLKLPAEDPSHRHGRVLRVGRTKPTSRSAGAQASAVAGNRTARCRGAASYRRGRSATAPPCRWPSGKALARPRDRASGFPALQGGSALISHFSGGDLRREPLRSTRPILTSRNTAGRSARDGSRQAFEERSARGINVERVGRSPLPNQFLAKLASGWKTRGASLRFSRRVEAVLQRLPPRRCGASYP